MVPLYRKADRDGLKEHISKYVDSVVHFTDCDLDDLWSSFPEELTTGIKQFIPNRFTSSRNGLPYVSPSLKRVMKKRDKIHARKDPRYKTIKHEVQKELRAAYWQYVEEIITPTNDEDSMGAKKCPWGLLKHSKSDSKGVPPLKHQGNLINNAAGKATVLNSYFQSAFTSHVPLDLKQLCQNQCDRVFDHTRYRTPSMPPISITTDGVAMLLDNLQPHKAAGPEGLSSMVLRELFSVIAPAHQKIFSESLSSHQVPED